MNACLTERYGNPCRGCGYTWSTDADVCRGMIEESPGRVAALLEGRDGSENLPVLEWNARAYVAHMADNLRIWSERLAAVVLDPSALVTPYEEGDLARARGYQSLPLQGVLWSLGRALEDWRVAEALAGSGSIVLRHPEQGRLELHEVRCVLAHEANHHTLDISSANLLALVLSAGLFDNALASLGEDGSAVLSEDARRRRPVGMVTSDRRRGDARLFSCV